MPLTALGGLAGYGLGVKGMTDKYSPGSADKIKNYLDKKKNK